MCRRGACVAGEACVAGGHVSQGACVAGGGHVLYRNNYTKGLKIVKKTNMTQYTQY